VQEKSWMELLNKMSIAQHLQSVLSDAVSCDLDIFPCVTSTNTVCADYAANQTLHKPYVCIAEQQTAGRGRRGRVWDSPAGSGLYFSIAWRIADIEAWQGLSLAVGLVLVQAMEKNLNAQSLKLKWPNDILQADKKLGGVLIEIVRDATNASVLVIGAGINCQHTAAIAEPDNERAYLSETVDELDKNQLVADLIATIIFLLQDYESKQFTAYRADWEHYDAYREREVVLLSAGNITIAGIERGVNARGELRVDVDGVIRTVNAGELSLRLAG
jgi:BirA family biotin operon repressor/biotin-[acetyl-CoA-carboxylase] ligase